MLVNGVFLAGRDASGLVAEPISHAEALLLSVLAILVQLPIALTCNGIMRAAANYRF
jgi:hypothetical protein